MENVSPNRGNWNMNENEKAKNISRNTSFIYDQNLRNFVNSSTQADSNMHPIILNFENDSPSITYPPEVVFDAYAYQLSQEFNTIYGYLCSLIGNGEKPIPYSVLYYCNALTNYLNAIVSFIEKNENYPECYMSTGFLQMPTRHIAPYKIFEEPENATEVGDFPDSGASVDSNFNEYNDSEATGFNDVSDARGYPVHDVNDARANPVYGVSGARAYPVHGVSGAKAYPVHGGNEVRDFPVYEPNEARRYSVPDTNKATAYAKYSCHPMNAYSNSFATKYPNGENFTTFNPEINFPDEYHDYPVGHLPYTPFARNHARQTHPTLMDSFNRYSFSQNERNFDQHVRYNYQMDPNFYSYSSSPVHEYYAYNEECPAYNEECPTYNQEYHAYNQKYATSSPESRISFEDLTKEYQDSQDSQDSHYGNFIRHM